MNTNLEEINLEKLLGKMLPSDTSPRPNLTSNLEQVLSFYGIDKLYSFKSANPSANNEGRFCSVALSDESGSQIIKVSKHANNQYPNLSDQDGDDEKTKQRKALARRIAPTPRQKFWILDDNNTLAVEISQCLVPTAKLDNIDFNTISSTIYQVNRLQLSLRLPQNEPFKSKNSAFLKVDPDDERVKQFIAKESNHATIAINGQHYLGYKIDGEVIPIPFCIDATHIYESNLFFIRGLKYKNIKTINHLLSIYPEGIEELVQHAMAVENAGEIIANPNEISAFAEWLTSYNDYYHMPAYAQIKVAAGHAVDNQTFYIKSASQVKIGEIYENDERVRIIKDGKREITLPAKLTIEEASRYFDMVINDTTPMRAVNDPEAVKQHLELKQSPNSSLKCDG